MNTDVSNNSAIGLLPAFCGTLKGNRFLTALKVCGNQINSEGVQCLRKFFGDVNAQSGVLWGNRMIMLVNLARIGGAQAPRPPATTSSQATCAPFWCGGAGRHCHFDRK